MHAVSYKTPCLERPHACFNTLLSHLKIFNKFLIKFSFCTEPYKLYYIDLLLRVILFYFFLSFFSFIFISWRLITLQYCSGFCHTLTWISHGVTCVPHPEPPSHLPPHPIPLGHPNAPAPSTCLMHPTWTGHLFHTW